MTEGRYRPYIFGNRGNKLKKGLLLFVEEA